MRQKNCFHLDLHKVGKDKVFVEVSSNLNQWENVLKKNPDFWNVCASFTSKFLRYLTEVFK